MKLQDINREAEFDHRLINNELPDRLWSRGIHSFLLPTEVSVFLVSTEENLPWTVPGTEVSINRDENNKFIVSPNPEGKLLGVVGFDTAGERIYWSSNRFRFRDRETEAIIDFHDNTPAHFMVVRLDDYEVESTPFLFATSIDTQSFKPSQNSLVQFGPENFFVARYDYQSDPDTTTVKITSDSTGRSLQSMKALDEDGQLLRPSRWSRGRERDQWSYQLTKSWNGRVDKVILLGFRDVSLEPTETDFTPDHFYKSKRRELLDEHRAQKFEVVNHRVDTGLHQLTITLELDTSSLQQPVLVFGYPKTTLRTISGQFWKVIEPGQESVTFHYRGGAGADRAIPHVEGWTLSRRFPSRHTAYTIDSLDATFGRSTVEEESQTTSAPDVSIESLEVNPHSIAVSGRVNQALPEAENSLIYLFLSIDKKSRLSAFTPRWNQQIYPRARLLLNPREDFQLSLTRALTDSSLPRNELKKRYLGVYLMEMPAESKRPNFSSFETIYEDAIPVNQLLD